MNRVCTSTDELRTLRVRLSEIRHLEASLAAEKISIVSHIEALSAPDIAPLVAERELVTHAGLTPREARDVVARTEVVESLPALGEALARATTTSAHIDVLARAMRTAAPEREAFAALLPELAESATSLGVADFAQLCRETARSVLADGGLSIFERQRRSVYLRGRFDTEGGLNLSGYLDPERGAALWSRIEKIREQMFHQGDDPQLEVMPWVEPNEHRAALALVHVFDAGASSDDDHDTPTPARAEVVVHIDLASLTAGPHAHSTAHTVYGGDLPVATIRRLACEAEIIPVVLGGHGVPIDVGRSRRLATANQRRALEAFHSTCAVPDCAAPFHHCQIHHIEYWESGGSTDLDNMVPLCSRHHHAVHEGGWKLALEPLTRHVTVDRRPET